jgi:hypothetical protein
MVLRRRRRFGAVRASIVSTTGNALAVIVNEVGTGMFMSYDGQ